MEDIENSSSKMEAMESIDEIVNGNHHSVEKTVESQYSENAVEGETKGIIAQKNHLEVLPEIMSTTKIAVTSTEEIDANDKLATKTNESDTGTLENDTKMENMPMPPHSDLGTKSPAKFEFPSNLAIKVESNSSTGKVSTKTSEAKYPGMSYILFVKSKSGGDSWFECGLCAPESKMMPKEMTVHLRSVNHLQNLMEVECSHLRDKFLSGKESVKDSQELLKDILEFELNLPNQIMVAATPENIMVKREELLDKINKSKLSTTSPQSNGDNKNNDADDLENELLQCDYEMDDSRIYNEHDETTHGDNENEMEPFSNVPKEVKPIVIIPDYKFFQEGFQGKHFFMFVLDSSRKMVRESLHYSSNHPYYPIISKSYVVNPKELTRYYLYKFLTQEEGDFLYDNFNTLYLDKNVLSFRHKPILPECNIQDVVKLFHNVLRHPSSGVLFEILSREFFVFPERTLDFCEYWQEKCPICNATPESLFKAHSFKVIEAYNDWPNKREMKALSITGITNVSYCRNPTKIVIIGDERDTFLKTIAMTDVFVRICPGLNLENAFDFISCDPLFGTGVLFVMLCGTFSFVRWSIDPDCHRNQCSEPLLIPSVVCSRETNLFTQCMTAARNLHHSLMLSSPKDDVIFSHVLPIALSINAKHLAAKHNRQCNHKSTPNPATQPSIDMYVSLNLGMLHYNGWTDRFAIELGYYPWNLSAGFFAEAMSKGKKIQKFNLGKLSEDGVNFTAITQQLRKDMVTDIARTTLQKINQREKNGLLKNYVRAINPSVSKLKTVHRFEKIIIFCEPDTKVLLDPFASNQVLITSNEITPPVIEQLCAQFNLKQCNTLWIFTSSVRPIAQKMGYVACSPSIDCPIQLPFIAPRDDLAVSKEAAQDGINTLLANVKELVKMTKNIVGERCVTVVAPVMPVTIVNGDLVKHYMVHTLYQKMPQVFICNNASLEALLPIYEILREESVNLCISLFMDQGLYPQPVFNYKPRIKGSFRTLGPKQVYFHFLPIEWEDMFRNLIYASLNGFPLSLTDPIADNINRAPKEYLSEHLKPYNNGRFTRIVFLGNQNFTEIVSKFECPLAQLIHLDFNDSEEEINIVIDRVSKFPSKTLFIYLNDFSLITTDRPNKTVCERYGCINPFTCTVLKNEADSSFKGVETLTFVDQVVKITHQKIHKIANAVNGSSFFIVAPLCPLKGFPISLNPDEFHKQCHHTKPIKNEFQYLEGNISDWHIAGSTLDKLWTFVMESHTPNIGAPYRAILNYEVRKEYSLLTPHHFSYGDSFVNLKMWKASVAIFIDLCLKMRKDGKFVEKKKEAPPLPPPAPPLNLLSFGKRNSAGQNQFSMAALAPPPMMSAMPPSPSVVLSEPTGFSLSFPGMQTYAYPVPALKPPLPDHTTIISKDRVYGSNISSFSASGDNTVQKSDGSDFRIMVGKIESSISDLEINMILSVIGDFIIFERPKVKNASYGVAKFLSEDSAERCVRLLDNYSLKDGQLEVRYLYYRDGKEDCGKLGLTVQQKDEAVKNLVDDIVMKLKLNVTEELKNVIIPKQTQAVGDQQESGTDPEKVLGAEVKKEETASNDVVEILAQTQNPVGTSMAKSQAKKLANYLKRKKLSPSKSRSRSKSRDKYTKRRRSKSRYSRSYSRSRSRSRSWTRSRSRSYSRSRSRSPYNNRNRGGFRHHNRGGRFFNFRGRFPRQRGFFFPNNRGNHFHNYHNFHNQNQNQWRDSYESRDYRNYRDERPPPIARRESRDYRGTGSRSSSRSPSRHDERPPIPRRPKSPRGAAPKSPPPRQKSPNRPKSPPRERKVLSVISSEEETFIVHSPPEPIMHEIKITNVPLMVTMKFLNDLFMSCGSPSLCKKDPNSETYIAEFSSLKRATMVAQQLNNWRLIDKNLKVEVIGDTKGVENQISMVEDSAIAKEIENVFEEFRESFIVKIQGDIMKDPDIFTFKIFKCGVLKCREYDCHYYHNIYDQRRDYLEFKYKEKMCPFIRQQEPCPKGEYCNLCHTPVERIYHPKNYKTNVCLDWYELKKCPKKSFCAKAHPMNPDSFFTEAWKDMFIAGLDQSFFFFAGAIKMLYKVPDNEGGVPVIFITTIPEIAKFACEVAKPMAKIHRLKIAIITDTMQDPGSRLLCISHYIS